MRPLHGLLVGLGLLLAVACAGPAAAENVLRWASAGGVLTWDPHATTETPSLVGFRQVYETLVTIDTDLTLQPGLAVAWRLVTPTTWRFDLREGVTFHDGTPLGAEDVVFSIDRARGEKSGLTSYTESIDEVAVAGRHEIEIRTKRPDLILPVNLRNIAIMSRAWAERRDLAKVVPHDAHVVNQANGTGPFVLQAHEPNRRTALVRNPRWWGLAQYPHNIDQIVWTVMPDAEQRLEALLRGDIDFLQDPPLESLDRIRQRPGLRLAQTGELRVLLLGLNQGTAELHSSDVEGANPLKDRRVRQAIYQAIDIAAIRDEVMQGLAIPAGMTITPGVNGYATELDQRLAFDPRAAKSLLDQAGYGDGFALRLDCPSNRYLNDAAICDALGAQLRTIGIRVTVDNQPKDIHFAKIFQRETDFYLLGFLTPSFDSALHFHELFHGRPGPWGATGYANPVLDALIERIDGELGTYHRDAMIEQAWKIILDDIVVVPLHRQVVVWALRETLDLPMSPLNSPSFREARLN
jgi:peptide/nickel transport system substrate-binding protein